MKTFQKFRSDAALNETFITRAEALQAYAEGIADGSIRVCESCGSPNLFEVEKFGMTCVDCGIRTEGVVPVREIQEPDEALQSGFDEAEEECPHCGNMRKEGEPCHCWQSGHHNEKELEEDGGAGGGAAGGAGSAGAGSGAATGGCTCGESGGNTTCAIHGSYGLGYGTTGYPYKKKKRHEMGEEAPTNNAGSGNIAGIGVGPQGEPGVSPEYQRKRNQLKLVGPPPSDPRMFRAKIFGRNKPKMM